MSKKPERITSLFDYIYLLTLSAYGDFPATFSIDDLIERFQNLKQQGHTTLTITAETEFYTNEFTSLQVMAHHYRGETLEEYEKRLAQWQEAEDNKKQITKQRRKDNLERDRKEYERLRKKFEGDKAN